jgi:hypothetical protein
MKEALAFCRERYDTVVLTTRVPDFCARLGFRAVREHAFSRALAASPPSPGGRVLTGAPDDLGLLRPLLERRAPVSERLGSLEAGTVFVIALLLTWGDFSRVHYHAALDAVTVHEVRDGTLVLYDVVAPAIPPLPVLAAAIGGGAGRVVTFFAPDRLGEGFVAEPWDRARAEALGDDRFAGLMAQGPFPGRTGRSCCPPCRGPEAEPRARPEPSSRAWRPPRARRYAYDTPIVSAMSAGLDWPSTSTVISEVTRTPPWISSTLAMRWRSRMRAPAGTGLMKRTLLEP